MKQLSAQQVIDALGLQPHPEEGGFFIETHRADESFAKNLLPARYDGDRCHGTAIYYMLTPETYSHMHLLQSDEIFHFYLGDPCEQLQLHPDGSGEVITFGTDILNNQRPQIIVPRGSWQGMRLLPGGSFALMGCTVAPGFEFADYAHGKRSALVEQYPDFAKEIALLTAE
ncbi:cupin domain-containing protein [Pseudodesulfovibrio sp. zrk46]|uniref:cupin domain-containing protein n=1 Tax=Pseudodesulfovibrio sp. zrk46 TaxID=2725288 RepID=UPI001448CFDC|nr:cupin domain-containing protein [Pseudodesulfovibrio sp. zrk46]QJB56179.1 cupin domain-containing protein [Pseudodesulfovibrio sp. zrk46]